jgi:ParB-like chromosome segregation protein Spo0J
MTATVEEEQEVFSQEELQYAPLIAKLREWNLQYEYRQDFPVEEVKRSAAAQVRESSHIAPAMRVEEYSYQMRNGAIFPPILLRTPNILIDGNTRLAAAKRIGRKTFHAIIVDARTPEMAKILAAAVNQMGGERLTPGEAHEASLLMMQQGYPDPAIARELGRDVAQVRRWRQQRDVIDRASKAGLEQQTEQINRSALGTLAAVTHEEPFGELVKLFADVRPNEKKARELVNQVMEAPSDEAAIRAIGGLREELAPEGPPPHAARRSEVPLVRAAIANLLKLQGRVTAGFDPAQRELELARWQALRAVVEEVLAALAKDGQ